MVVLNRIYTRTGDGGETALGNGERVPAMWTVRLCAACRPGVGRKIMRALLAMHG